MCRVLSNISPPVLQVTPIWEGTTNILSLDVLRAIRKSSAKSSATCSSSIPGAVPLIPTVLHNFQRDVVARISAGRELRHLQAAADKLETSLDSVLKRWLCLDSSQQDMAAREMAYSLARIYMGKVLHCISQS